jgi:hypothetical protein
MRTMRSEYLSYGADWLGTAQSADTQLTGCPGAGHVICTPARVPTGYAHATDRCDHTNSCVSPSGVSSSQVASSTTVRNASWCRVR